MARSLGIAVLTAIIAAPLWAQSPPPAPPEATATPPAEPPGKRPPVFAAKWPFKWPSKKANAKPVDPFLGQGANEQVQLAVQLAGPQASTALQQSSAASQPGYPWPPPVDSQASFSRPSTWSQPASPAQPAVVANQPPPFEPPPASVPNALPSPMSATAFPPVALPTPPMTTLAGASARQSSVPLTPPPIPEPTESSIPLRGEPEESSRLLAIVGDQSILYGDIAGQINEMLAPYEGQAPPKQIEAQRELLVQRFLPRVVDNKIVFLDFLRKIPPERMPEIEQDVFRQYNETQLPEVLEKTGLQSAAELDEYLRTMGSSLAKQQRMYLERIMRHEAVRTEVKVDKEVSHEELVDYYRENAATFEFEGRAKWERLVVNKSNFSTPAEAYQALVEMGNEVLRGAPLDAVAKRSSQGPNASEGGGYDWTTQGSLRSEQVDTMIFSMPLGKLSRIVEDESSYHILRVIERIDAGKQQFADVQEIIKDKIRERRFDEQAQAYLDRLRKETYVWVATEPLDGSAGSVAPAGFTP